MSSIRPRRARLLGALTLVLGLLASLTGLVASPAGAQVPQPVESSEAAATVDIRCEGDIAVVVFTFYNFADETRVFSASHVAGENGLIGDHQIVPKAGPEGYSTRVAEHPAKAGAPIINGIQARVIFTPYDIVTLIPQHTITNPCLNVDAGETTGVDELGEAVTVESVATCVETQAGPRVRWLVDVTNPNQDDVPVTIVSDGFTWNSTADAATADGPTVSSFATTPRDVAGDASLEVKVEGQTVHGPVVATNPCEEDPESGDEVPGDGGEPASKPPVGAEQWPPYCEDGLAKLTITFWNQSEDTDYEVGAGYDGAAEVGVAPHKQGHVIVGGQIVLLASADAGSFENVTAWVGEHVLLGPIDVPIECDDETPGTPGLPETPETPELPELPDTADAGSSGSEVEQPDLPQSVVTATTVGQAPSEATADPVEPHADVVASEVLGVGSGAAVAAAQAFLPRTGSSTFALLVLGLAMSLAGALLLVAGGRREVV